MLHFVGFFKGKKILRKDMKRHRKSFEFPSFLLHHCHQFLGPEDAGSLAAETRCIEVSAAVLSLHVQRQPCAMARDVFGLALGIRKKLHENCRAMLCASSKHASQVQLCNFELLWLKMIRFHQVSQRWKDLKQKVVL